MNGSLHETSLENGTDSIQLSAISLYLDSIKGVLLLWHEEIMAGGHTHNLKKLLLNSAKDIASYLQSDQSREQLKIAHELVMKAIEQNQAWYESLEEKQEKQLCALRNHFDERYQNIVSSDLTYNSLPETGINVAHMNGSYHLDSWDLNKSNDNHSQDQFKLSEHAQQLTLSLEKKHMQEIEELKMKHAEQLKKTEEFYENQLADQKVNASFRKVEQAEEIDEIIKDRDNLREMTKNLRQAVIDLTNYLNNCENQLNKTLLNELLDDTSVINECSSFQKLKHVHFAPDMSHIITENGLDYSDLRIELETCLDRLKQEATELFSLTVNKGKHQSVAELINKYEKEIDQLKQDAITPELRSLQDQLQTADARLKSSRQFIEEQAQERETEREEFLNQISQLKSTLRDQKLYSSLDEESKLLQQQLEKTQLHLTETAEAKRQIELDLSKAKNKIQELRHIVTTLEIDLASSRKNEEVLMEKIVDFKELFEKENQKHEQLVNELENLKINSNYQEQVLETLDNPIHDSGLHQIKSQILWLEKSLLRRTKELETLYVFDPNLSSPSEDISARDEMVNTPDSGRVDSPGLPLEQMNSLYDQFVRHSKAEDATVKCLKDTVIQLTSTKAQLNEVVLEREALEERYNKTLTDLCEARVQIDELRQRLFAKKVSHEDEKNAVIDNLEDKVKILKNALLIKKDEIKQKDKMIEQHNSPAWSMEQEVSKTDTTDMRLRDASVMSQNVFRKPSSPVVHFNDTSTNDTNTLNFRDFSFEKPRTISEHSIGEMLKEENNNLKKELVRKENVISEMKSDADNLRTMLSELQEKVDEAKLHTANIEEEENEILQYKNEKERKLEEVQLLQEQIIKLNEDLGKIKHEYEVLNKNRAECKQVIDILEGEIRKKKEECSKYQMENNQLKAQLEISEDRFTKFEKELILICTNLKGNKMENEGFSSCIESISEELKHYLKKVEQLNVEKDGFIKKENEITKENESLKKKCCECEQIITNLKSTELKLRGIIESLEEKSNGLNDKLICFIENESKLTKELNQLRFSCEMYNDKVRDSNKREELINNLMESMKLSEQSNVELKREVLTLRQIELELRNKLVKYHNYDIPLEDTIEISDVQQEDKPKVSPDLKLELEKYSIKDEDFGKLAERLKKELQLSAKLDEELLKKQEDYVHEQQEKTIFRLTKENTKLNQILTAERARFDSEQLQDADLLEKLRQKCESQREKSNLFINNLQTDLNLTNAQLIQKMKEIDNLQVELRKSEDQVAKFQVESKNHKELLDQVNMKYTKEIDLLKDKIHELDLDLKNVQEIKAQNLDLQQTVKDQVIALNSKAMQLCHLEKMCSEYKLKDTKLQEMEDKINSLNETLLTETKKVLLLESKLVSYEQESEKSNHFKLELNKKIHNLERDLQIEKECVITLREKLLEKSSTLAEEYEKSKQLESRIQILSQTKESEIDHSKQMRYILARLMRAESCNKSLIFQKRYLKNMINSYVSMECKTVQAFEGRPHVQIKKISFRSVALAAVSICRMKYLQKKRSHTMLRRLK